MGTRTSWTALAASGVLAVAVSWAAPASAAMDPFVADIDPPDTEVDFFGGSSNQGWTGADRGNMNINDPINSLDNNSTDTEGNYLSALLGFVASDPGRPQLIMRIETSGGGSPVGETTLPGFDPGFDWTYAVVKTGAGQGGHYFFQDDGDGILMADGSFPNAISHVTFLTPIPAAAWMLLTGLAAFFGLRWRQRRNEAVAAA